MPTVSQTRTSVRRYLSTMGPVETGDDGVFSLRNGSARVFVSVEDFADGDTWVRISCPVLGGVVPTPALFEYVALNSANYRYGCLTVERDKDEAVTIVLVHGVLGTYLDPEELRIAVAMLADSADVIDDQLKARFGGMRFHEED